jgi:hypothetical protein
MVLPAPINVNGKASSAPHIGTVIEALLVNRIIGQGVGDSYSEIVTSSVRLLAWLRA